MELVIAVTGLVAAMRSGSSGVFWRGLRFSEAVCTEDLEEIYLASSVKELLDWMLVVKMGLVIAVTGLVAAIRSGSSAVFWQGRKFSEAV